MHLSLSRPRTADEGFTLIELSIVLVIIGLIVGGVLVGQDLIKAAEIRATVGQVEKYNAAVNTFRTKYNGMPGDLAATQAAAFGLYSSGMDGTTGKGDGNGLLSDSSAVTSYQGIGETIVFWRHLSDAGLVDGSFGQDAYLASGGVVSTTTNPALYLPTAKMGRGNMFAVATTGGQNYYYLSGVKSLPASGAYTFTSNITPIEAYNMDVKLDDGAPYTGVVQAHGAGGSTGAADSAFLTSAAKWTTATPASAASGDCVTGGTNATDTANGYARGATPGTAPACQLRFRFN